MKNLNQSYLAIGIALGVVLGLAFNNLAIGIALGVSLGLVFGAPKKQL
ncbi:hypothetical protein [Mucilaginibacter sp. FT3.2]|nr:hypothetical protein [Mucilaginibacter sp. FT3.2]MBB6234318.1 hypothetical protein [Mucilaginibacter sp. FT3.2]